MMEIRTETFGKIAFDEFIEIMKSDSGALEKNVPAG